MFKDAVAWLLLPHLWLVLIQVAGLFLLWRKRYRAAGTLFAVTTLCIIAVTKLPVVGALARSLEQATPAPSEALQRVDGIIVLAGAEDIVLTAAYGKPHFNAESERIAEFAAMARKHPGARLVHAGRAGMASSRISQAEVVRRYFVGQGLDPGTIIFEEQSGNTGESAIATHRLLRPRHGENWVLITSALHMPRAYGAFRKAGWEIVPYPVAYRTLPDAWTGYGGSYETLTMAIHEWVGLLAYRTAGRL